MVGGVTFARFYVPDVRSTERPRRDLALTNVRLSRSQSIYRRRAWRVANKHRRGLHVVTMRLFSVPPWAA